MRKAYRKFRDRLLKYYIIRAEDKNIYHIGAATFAVFVDSTEMAKKLYEKVVKVCLHQWNVKREALSHEYSYYYVTYPG